MNICQNKKDERVFKAIKRNETVYSYLLSDPRSHLKEIENHIKNKG